MVVAVAFLILFLRLCNWLAFNTNDDEEEDFAKGKK
jgi:hypothetical protein